MKSAAVDNSRTLHARIAHSQLTVDIYSTSRRSPFSRRESFDSPRRFLFLFFDFFPPLPPPVSFSPLRHAREGREGKPRLTCALRSVHVCTYVHLRVDMSEGNEFVCLGTRITCFTCRLELLEKFTRVFA